MIARREDEQFATFARSTLSQVVLLRQSFRTTSESEFIVMTDRFYFRLIAFFVLALMAMLATSAKAQSQQMAPEGMGMWNKGKTPPHLVLRSPLELKKQSAKHPTIPYSQKLIRWKQPYAYGYFGARSRRHPMRSFGHQQAYTEWRFR